MKTEGGGASTRRAFSPSITLTLAFLPHFR